MLSQWSLHATSLTFKSLPLVRPPDTADKLAILMAPPLPVYCRPNQAYQLKVQQQLSSLKSQCENSLASS